MNKPLITRAAEGLDRWGWTNAQLQKLVDAGLMDEDAPIELIKGEIVPMASELNAHFKMRMRLTRRLILVIETTPPPGPKLIVGTEASVFLFDDTEFKPDVTIFPEEMDSARVRGPDLLIAIEVAASSHRRDRIIKPPIYAESGVRELWVVDLDREETFVHRDPKGGAYCDERAFTFDAALSPLALPNVSIQSSDLG